jgi:hypothetical protein
MCIRCRGRVDFNARRSKQRRSIFCLRLVLGALEFDGQRRQQPKQQQQPTALQLHSIIIDDVSTAIHACSVHVHPHGMSSEPVDLQETADCRKTRTRPKHPLEGLNGELRLRQVTDACVFSQCDSSPTTLAWPLCPRKHGIAQKPMPRGHTCKGSILRSSFQRDGSICCG